MVEKELTDDDIKFLYGHMSSDQLLDLIIMLTHELRLLRNSQNGSHNSNKNDQLLMISYKKLIEDHVVNLEGGSYVGEEIIKDNHTIIFDAIVNKEIEYCNEDNSVEVCGWADILDIVIELPDGSVEEHDDFLIEIDYTA
jgi:hypothetical protein